MQAQAQSADRCPCLQRQRCVTENAVEKADEAAGKTGSSQNECACDQRLFTVSMVNERRMRKVLLLKDIDHAPEEVYKNICGGMD